MIANRVYQIYDEDGNPTYQLNSITFSKLLRSYNGKKATILFYMLDNMDRRSNMFYGTQSSISRAVDLSRPTVGKVMKELRDDKLISLLQPGVWELKIENIA